ncbi:RidA family protein [Hwanghaeella grinnelliae]|uniref:RidA family protein n=1 Tax=Hwanghaeella grinnelliae TaxID=2500179 RepID=A0A3S2VR54_9PROT|nr:RidA family protein [Hwanghaeella grinnelliae]RVU38435.1 RidA family protein [Hwanghaeella grinnelliae]
MPRTVIRPPSLSFQPRPTFPYSPGATDGRLVYTAGQVSWGPDGNLVGVGDIVAQTRQTLSNVMAVLETAGATLDDVLKCNVYLKDMGDFQAMNAEFARVFPNDPPARTTVQTPLSDPEMLVEIEAVASLYRADTP